MKIVDGGNVKSLLRVLNVCFLIYVVLLSCGVEARSVMSYDDEAAGGVDRTTGALDERLNTLLDKLVVSELIRRRNNNNNNNQRLVEQDLSQADLFANQPVASNADDSIDAYDDNNYLLDLPKPSLMRKFRIRKSLKRSFDIRTYYDALVQNDGSILLIPKDINRNHYFIG